MKVILDRRSCTCWLGSCESCFAGYLLQEHFCPACLLEEVEDGRQALSVLILDRDDTEKSLVVTEDNWGEVFDSWLLAWQETNKQVV